MLKENNQLSFCLSSYASLFDVLIEKDNFWRQLKDMVDFSFVYDELKDKYSSTMGRKAEDVVRMFKYLLLKNYYKLSDRDLIARTKTDMLFKYFLDYLPEEVNLIDPMWAAKIYSEMIVLKKLSQFDLVVKNIILQKWSY